MTIVGEQLEISVLHQICDQVRGGSSSGAHGLEYDFGDEWLESDDEFAPGILIVRVQAKL